MSERSRRAADRRLADIGERYLAALCCADAPTAEAVVAEALLAGITPTSIMVDVITAAMRRIGECWEQGELTAAEEHLATGVSYRALLPLQEPLQTAPPRSRERVVLAAVAGQTHVLGLRMVADVLEGAGFDVLNLGADVPADALQEFVADHEPAVLGLTSTLPRDGPRLAEAIVATHGIRPECRIMLGGEGVPPAWRGTPYRWVPDAGAALDAVDELLHGPPQELAPTIERLPRGCAQTPPSATLADTTEDDERLAGQIAEESELTRRYARRAAEYRYLAYRDPLTALPNRRAFDDRLIALSTLGPPNALLVIDVDEFKQLNDTQGHEVGDALLRQIGQEIRGAVRAGDTVARIGGDEFTVLMPACTQAEAGRVAEQIRAAVLEMSGGEVSVSIGGATLDVDRRSAVLDADRALYAAKAAGRNRSEVPAAP